MDEGVLIAVILYMALSVPFLAHFIMKVTKMISLKLKRKKIINNGKYFRCRIIDSVRGKQIFKDTVTGNVKYSYYPVVEIYTDGEYHKLTSPFAVNNSDKTALRDKNATMFLYKDDFILTEVCPAKSSVHSLDYINAGNKRSYHYTKGVGSRVVLITVVSFTIINIIRLVFKILVEVLF